MKTNKLIGLISPRDGIAGLLSDDRQFVTIVAPSWQDGQRLSIFNYISRFPDTTRLEIDNPDQVISSLGICQQNSIALDFTLSLFDRSVDTRTRELVARELEYILSDKTCCDYVLDILLSSPLPDDADTEGASAVAGRWKNAQVIVHHILASQPNVRKAYFAWLAVRADLIEFDVQIENVHGALIKSGVFRLLVENIKASDDANVIMELISSKDLKQRCGGPFLRRLVEEFLHRLTTESQLEPSTFSSTELHFAIWSAIRELDEPLREVLEIVFTAIRQQRPLVLREITDTLHIADYTFYERLETGLLRIETKLNSIPEYVAFIESNSHLAGAASNIAAILRSFGA